MALYQTFNLLFRIFLVPEKFINITLEEGATELTLQCNEKERRVAWYVLKLFYNSFLLFERTIPICFPF